MQVLRDIGLIYSIVTTILWVIQVFVMMITDALPDKFSDQCYKLNMWLLGISVAFTAVSGCILAITS